MIDEQNDEFLQPAAEEGQRTEEEGPPADDDQRIADPDDSDASDDVAFAADDDDGGDGEHDDGELETWKHRALSAEGRLKVTDKQAAKDAADALRVEEGDGTGDAGDSGEDYLTEGRLTAILDQRDQRKSHDRESAAAGTAAYKWAVKNDCMLEFREALKVYKQRFPKGMPTGTSMQARFDTLIELTEVRISKTANTMAAANATADAEARHADKVLNATPDSDGSAAPPNSKRPKKSKDDEEWEKILEAGSRSKELNDFAGPA